MKPPEPQNRTPGKVAHASDTTPRKPEPTRTEPRGSIFDASYAPVGAELRKAWSRFDRKKQ